MGLYRGGKPAEQTAREELHPPSRTAPGSPCTRSRGRRRAGPRGRGVVLLVLVIVLLPGAHDLEPGPAHLEQTLPKPGPLVVQLRARVLKHVAPRVPERRLGQRVASGALAVGGGAHGGPGGVHGLGEGANHAEAVPAHLIHLVGDALVLALEVPAQGEACLHGGERECVVAASAHEAAPAVGALVARVLGGVPADDEPPGLRVEARRLRVLGHLPEHEQGGGAHRGEKEGEG
mmetsp:Transcript_5230/g.17599  ORF Transcript_5230/g.17599 Transcript_5230/m.17599 type:complete len:233 (+) Transcript_5230:90-788(+)